jgi:NADH-quinone oxidoreductase subunit G
MIDVCPVGALTSKPFRYSARTWELSRRKSVAPHDSLGSNIIVQVKQDKVMRVLPLENEAINECWISDRDRFSYEALNSADRLQKPMIKKGNLWAEVEWQEALDAVVAETNRVKAQHGASAIALLASPQSTIEELHLAAKLIWGLGSENIESRLRQADKRSDGRVAGARWLGMKVAEVSTLESVLMVGATLRNEQPLLASRFRQAVKKGLQLNVVHSVDDDLLMGVANKEIVKPSALAWVLGGIAKALTELKSASLPNDVANAVAPIEVTPAMLSIAKSLSEKQRTAVFLGNFALHHPAYSTLHVLAQEIARLSGGTLGIWGDGANSVGAEVIGAVPRAAQSSARKAYFLLGVEPALDVYDPSALNSELSQAEVVVAFSSFKSAIPSTATIALPIAPFTETAGTFVNAEGTVQSFNGVVKPLGDTRPAWKVLRVLGNLFGLDGFDQESIEAVRTEIAPDLQAFVSSRLNNVISGIAPDVKMTMGSIERVAEAPIYGGDAMVRRANSLQMTPTAKRARIAMLSRDIFDELGGASSSEVRVTTAIGSVVMSAKCDPALPSGTARIGILPETAALGPVSGTVSIQKVTVAAAAE